MRIGYTPEQEELRRELRSYFAGVIPVQFQSPNDAENTTSQLSLLFPQWGRGRELDASGEQETECNAQLPALHSSERRILHGSNGMGVEDVDIRLPALIFVIVVVFIEGALVLDVSVSGRP